MNNATNKRKPRNEFVTGLSFEALATSVPHRRKRWRALLCLRHIEPAQVHHLGPNGDKVLHEFLVRIGAGVDFGQGTQLGVRAENLVDVGAGSIALAVFVRSPLWQRVCASDVLRQAVPSLGRYLPG